MSLSIRWLRLRAVWLLVLPFLWFARPTPVLLLMGGATAVVGLLIRGWAAGAIHKDRELTTTGPYAFTRNPLYLGSLLLGMGAALAGGRWVFPLAFLAFFVPVYSRTMKREEAQLESLFGQRFRHYAAAVPLLAPRLTAYRPAAGDATPSPGFSVERYLRNREYEALLGAVAGFAMLALRLVWP